MLELLVVCTAVGVGLLGGWWLRGPRPAAGRGPSASAPSGEASAAAAQVRALARNMASDVDNHRLVMQQITSELEALQEGDPSGILKSIAKLIESNDQIQDQLELAERKLRSQAQEIESHAAAALTDALTQLANRRALDEAMNQTIHRMASRGEPAVIMLLDIDHFKQLNDNYGHQAGDAVLRTVARVLRETVSSDMLVARHGGEEFAVLFTGEQLDTAAATAEQVRAAVGLAATEFDGIELGVTLSGGVAQLAAKEPAGSLMRRADQALYVAKETGRNRCYVHDGGQAIRVEQWITSRREPVAAEQPAARPASRLASEPAFRENLRRRMADWKAGGAPVCLLFLQIDDLDLVREQCGVKNATAMLRAAELTLKATMREMDHVGQFQGEAFSMLLPGSDLAGAVRAAERLRRAVARCALPRQYERRTFTASVVVADATRDEDEQKLIERARQSLAAVQARGRNGTYVDDGSRYHLVGAGQVSAAVSGNAWTHPLTELSAR